MPRSGGGAPGIAGDPAADRGRGLRRPGHADRVTRFDDGFDGVVVSFAGDDGDAGARSGAPPPAPQVAPTAAFLEKRRASSSASTASSGEAAKTAEPRRRRHLRSMPRRRGACSSACSRRSRSGHWVDSNQFRIGISVVVVLNAVFAGVAVLGLGSDAQPPDPAFAAHVAAEAAFLAIFAVELLLRLVAHGRACLGDGGTCLDLLLLAANALACCARFLSLGLAADVGSMGAVLRLSRLARLLRVLQVLRLFRFVAEVRFMLQGASSVLRALCSALVLLFVSVYGVALLATRYIGQATSDEVTLEYFGDLGRSVLTLLSAATLEGWPALARHLLDAEPGGPWLAAGVAAFAIATNLALTSLVLAAGVDRLRGLSERDSSRRCAKRSTRRLEKLLLQADRDRDGRLTLQEFEQAIYDEEAVQDELRRLQVDDAMDAKDVFRMLAADDDGSADASDLVAALFCTQASAPLAILQKSLRSLEAGQQELQKAVWASSAPRGCGAETGGTETPSGRAAAQAAEEARGGKVAPAEAPSPQGGGKQQGAEGVAAKPAPMVARAELAAAAAAGSEAAVRAVRRGSELIREQLLAAVERGAARAEEALDRRLAALEAALRDTVASAAARPPARVPGPSVHDVAAAAAQAAAPLLAGGQGSAMSASAEVFLAGLRRISGETTGARSPASSPLADSARGGAAAGESRYAQLMRTTEGAYDALRSAMLPRGVGGRSPSSPSDPAGFSTSTRPPAAVDAAAPGGALASPRPGGSDAAGTQQRFGQGWSPSPLSATEEAVESLIGPPGRAAAAPSSTDWAGSGGGAPSPRVLELSRWLVDVGLAGAPFDKLVITLDSIGVQLSVGEQDELSAVLQRAGNAVGPPPP